VKLLFDENLSPRLARRLADIFPRSAHVRDHALDQSDDRAIFDFAARNGFTIVSKDKDFRGLTVMLGPPPKFVQVMVGNSAVSMVEDLLREHAGEIHAFELHPERKVLLLSQRGKRPSS